MNTMAKIADSIQGQRETPTPTQPKVDESRPMHALIWNGKKDIRYVEKPRPCITHPKDVLLKITASSICGSDLHLYTGAMPDMHDGDILGHEFMGVIEEVGSGISKLEIGQRVVVAFDIACGSCDHCQREEYTGCEVTNPSNLVKTMYGHRPSAIYGYSHLTGGVPGGQAEYVRVPFAEINCLPIPDDVPDDKALFLSDLIPTSYHGTELGGVKEGSVVAIWGLGPIGLMTARWCQVKKAGRIIGIDCVPERIQLAVRELGIEVINFKEKNVVNTLLDMFPKGVDIAIECAGFEYATSLLHKIEMTLNLETDTSDIFNEMFSAVRTFGNVAVIGVYAGYTNHFPIGMMMEKDLTVRCGQSPTQKYWKMALDMVRSGVIDPTFTITHRMPLSAGPMLYKKFNDKDGVIKVLLQPHTLPE